MISFNSAALYNCASFTYKVESFYFKTPNDEIYTMELDSILSTYNLIATNCKEYVCQTI